LPDAKDRVDDFCRPSAPAMKPLNVVDNRLSGFWIEIVNNSNKGAIGENYFSECLRFLGWCVHGADSAVMVGVLVCERSVRSSFSSSSAFSSALNIAILSPGGIGHENPRDGGVNSGKFVGEIFVGHGGEFTGGAGHGFVRHEVQLSSEGSRMPPSGITSIRPWSVSMKMSGEHRQVDFPASIGHPVSCWTRTVDTMPGVTWMRCMATVRRIS
jgi:hypothetical protein